MRSASALVFAALAVACSTPEPSPGSVLTPDGYAHSCGEADLSGVDAGVSTPRRGDRFEPRWPVHTIFNELSGSDGLALADFDDDGRRDVIGAWEAGAAITLHRHPGREVRAPWPTEIVAAGIVGAEGVQADDIDGDGAPDVVFFGEYSGACVAFSRERATRWWRMRLPRSTPPDRWLDGVTADFDGDGDVDVMGAPASTQVYWWENPGGDDAWRPDRWRRHFVTGAWHVMRLFADDVDGDGDLDVRVAQRRLDEEVAPHQGWRWVENRLDEVGPGEPWLDHPVVEGAAAMMGCRGDLDGDGDDDYAMPFEDPVRLAWYERRGAELVEHPLALDERLGPRVIKGCAIGDVDADGQADLVITTLRHDESSVWLLSGPGFGWTPIGPHAWGSKFDAPELEDLDGDGDLDVVLSEENRREGLAWIETQAVRPSTSSPTPPRRAPPWLGP